MSSPPPEPMARMSNPEPTVRSGHPLLWILAAFPIACFTCALLTDIAYAITADMLWSDFSDWLLAAGTVIGVLAAIVGIIDIIANRRWRANRRLGPLVVGSLVVLILAVLDNLVHSRDAWTSVVPLGLVLSAIIVVMVLVTAWFGAASEYRQSGGVHFVGVRQ